MFRLKGWAHKPWRAHTVEAALVSTAMGWEHFPAPNHPPATLTLTLRRTDTSQQMDIEMEEHDVIQLCAQAKEFLDRRGVLP